MYTIIGDTKDDAFQLAVVALRNGVQIDDAYCAYDVAGERYIEVNPRSDRQTSDQEFKEYVMASGERTSANRLAALQSSLPDAASYMEEMGRPFNLMVLDHGVPPLDAEGKEGFGAPDTILYRELLPLLPPGTEGVFLPTCFAQSALEYANLAPAGTAIYPGVSATSVAYGDLLADQVGRHQGTDRDLDAASAFTYHMATAEFHRWVDRNTALNANDPYYAKQPLPVQLDQILPTEIAISGLGQHDIAEILGPDYVASKGDATHIHLPTLLAQMDGETLVHAAEDLAAELQRYPTISLTALPQDDSRVAEMYSPEFLTSLAEAHSAGVEQDIDKQGMLYAMAFTHLRTSGQLEQLVERAKENGAAVEQSLNHQTEPALSGKGPRVTHDPMRELLNDIAQRPMDDTASQLARDLMGHGVTMEDDAPAASGSLRIEDLIKSGGITHDTDAELGDDGMPGKDDRLPPPAGGRADKGDRVLQH